MQRAGGLTDAQLAFTLPDTLHESTERELFSIADGRVAATRYIGLVIIDGAERYLRPLEYSLLAYLAERADEPQDRGDVINGVWPDPPHSLSAYQPRLSTLLQRVRGALGPELGDIKGEQYGIWAEPRLLQ